MKNVCNVANNVAHETMQDAASEIKGDDEGITNTAVSVDGSWQKILHLMVRKQQF